MKWVKALERTPEERGYYFIKSRYGQMTCYYDKTIKGGFYCAWDMKFDSIVWLDEVEDSLVVSTATQLFIVPADYKETEPTDDEGCEFCGDIHCGESCQDEDW